MSHLVPFSIDGYTIRHVLHGDSDDKMVRDIWTRGHNIATEVWRGESYRSCEVEEGTMAFAVLDPDGALYGTWGLYRVRPLLESQPGIVSALPAPMFPQLGKSIPEPVITSSGYGGVINQDEIDKAVDDRACFWRLTFGLIERMVSHPLSFDDGSLLVIDHFRFPSASDGDQSQHEWSGVRPMFDLYCKIEVEFDSSDTAVKTLSGWKSPEPDPERSVGSFGV